MKIETTKPEPPFEPITITIENQDDLVALLRVLGKVSVREIQQFYNITESEGRRTVDLAGYGELYHICRERGLDPYEFVRVHRITKESK